MTENRFLRQQDIVDPGELAKANVTIIGCGAVGSFTALTLAKMGIGSITLFDPDSVEEHNISNQFYRQDDIGKKKVDALSAIIGEFEGTEIIAKPRLYSKQPLDGIVISAVDSMDARKKIWGSIVSQKGVALYLDSRMASQVIQLYSYLPRDPFSRKAFEATLIDESESLDEPCTARVIIYSVLPLAGLLARHVVAFLNEEWIEPAITFDLKTMTLLKNGVTNER